MPTGAPMSARVVYCSYVPFVYREDEIAFLVMNWPHPVVI